MGKNIKKIDEFKMRSTPISYTTVEINERKSSTYQDDLKNRVISGYGNIWGSRNGHGEKFVKGAWTRSIDAYGPDAKAAYKLKFRDRHGKSCALFDDLHEDDIGLFFRTKPFDDVFHANELLTQIKSGTINNFSVGFRHIWDKVEWEEETDSLIILEAKLFEVSGVDIPSDLETYTLRSEEDRNSMNDDIEDFIHTLPKENRLAARKIITRCISLNIEEPLDAKHRALENVNSKKACVDYNYLINNLKFLK